jgi:AcrR family transcriptional regulator
LPADLTTAARIRNAALALFAEHGPEATSVRAVAAAAGTSAPSVIRIFGSKEKLVEAVDDHVVGRIGEMLDAFVASADRDDARSLMQAVVNEPDLLGYLIRALTGGGVAGDVLFDRLYDISMSFLEQMEAAGVARPVADKAATVVWLMAADMGVLLLRRHLVRALGIDPFTPAGMDRIAAVELDLMTQTYLTFPGAPPDDPMEAEI